MDQAEYRDNRLHGAGASQKVAGHGLGGADGNFIGPVTEDFLDGHSFGRVIQWCRRTMGIDMIHIIGA